MEANIGRWAVNGAGQLGRIERIENGIYRGTNMNGITNWASMAPMLLNKDDARLIDYMVIG